MELRPLYYVHFITCCLVWVSESSLISCSLGWHPPLLPETALRTSAPSSRELSMPSQTAEWMGSCYPHLIDWEAEAPEQRAQPKVTRCSPGFPFCYQQGGRTRLGLCLLSLGGGWLRPRRRELPIWSLRASSLRARFGTVAPPCLSAGDVFGGPTGRGGAEGTTSSSVRVSASTRV